MWTRRFFVQQSSTALAAVLSGGVVAQAQDATTPGSIQLLPMTGMLEPVAGCDAADQIRLARSLGYTGFTDLDLLSHGEHDTRRMVLFCRSIHVQLGPVRLGCLAQAIPAEVAGMRSRIRQAASCGLTDVLVEVATGSPKAGCRRLDLFTPLRDLSDVAQEYGLRLHALPVAWAGHANSSYARTADLVDRLQQPNLRLSLDTYDCATGGESVLELVDRMGSQMDVLFVADAPGGRAPGTGELPWATLLNHPQFAARSLLLNLRYRAESDAVLPATEVAATLGVAHRVFPSTLPWNI